MPCGGCCGRLAWHANPVIPHVPTVLATPTVRQFLDLSTREDSRQSGLSSARSSQSTLGRATAMSWHPRDDSVRWWMGICDEVLFDE
jgi:hypothetical protein